MKKISIISILLLCFQFGFSQKFWVQSNISANFDLKKSYKVAILPVTSTSEELAKLADISYNKITNELMTCSRFQVVNKSTVQQAVNKFSFGISGMDASNYPELAKLLNADILMLCELTSEKQIRKKKEVGTVTAFIQIFDMKNEAIVVYSGKARSINPISAQAEAEFAIQKALEKLVKVCK